MLNRRLKLELFLTLGGFMSMAGCFVKAPPKPVLPPPPPIQAPPPPSLSSHLEGTWEYLGRNGAAGQVVFAPDGTATFKGALTFYNPGRWVLDSGRQELYLYMPQADYNKLQIFQMNVGDNEKAFDAQEKKVTYHFDFQTGTLNIAGWPYSKEEKINNPPELEEPVLK